MERNILKYTKYHSPTWDGYAKTAWRRVNSQGCGRTQRQTVSLSGRGVSRRSDTVLLPDVMTVGSSLARTIRSPVFSWMLDADWYGVERKDSGTVLQDILRVRGICCNMLNLSTHAVWSRKITGLCRLSGAESTHNQKNRIVQTTRSKWKCDVSRDTSSYNLFELIVYNEIQMFKNWKQKSSDENNSLAKCRRPTQFFVAGKCMKWCSIVANDMAMERNGI